MAGAVAIGGIFFRSKDPNALAAWYQTHLGVTTGGDGEPWQQQAGPTVVSIFAQASDYFAPDRQMMLNLRVSGLEALTEQLQLAGVKVITDEAWNHPEVGRFARIHDPDGNPIELWEPPSGQ